MNVRQEEQTFHLPALLLLTIIISYVIFTWQFLLICVSFMPVYKVQQHKIERLVCVSTYRFILQFGECGKGFCWRMLQQFLTRQEGYGIYLLDISVTTWVWLQISNTRNNYSLDRKKMYKTDRKCTMDI